MIAPQQPVLLLPREQAHPAQLPYREKLIGGPVMSLTKNMHCWEIMHCLGAGDCPARTYPDIPCWEIAALLGADMTALNICEECIVYLVKSYDPILTAQELEEILKMRNILWYLERCPAFEKRPWQREISRQD